MDRLKRAIEEWRHVLPLEGVLTGDSLDVYRVNCLSIERSIGACLRPACEAQVVHIVQIASHYKVPLYAISTGHNWGYGTSLPVAENCVIVDLSRMNRILQMDPELGLITLEPGVTQRQLFEYLSTAKLDFFVPTTGAGPTASIVGNALERGFGMTPESDHFAAVASVRAVLPNGRIYQPYMSEIGAAAADGIWKWGIGPYLDGLFAQGNFGIVTALQISLVRRPEHVEVFAFTQRDERKFSQLVDACREMFHDLKGPIGRVKFINQKQIEMTTGTRELGVGLKADFAWMGFGVIHCKRAMIGSLRASVRRSLKPLTSRLIFVNSRRLHLLKQLCRVTPSWLSGKLAEPVDRFQHLLEIVNGEPRGLELQLVYRHVPYNPTKESMDPIRDGVGVIWYAPAIPLKGAIVGQMVEMIQGTLQKYSFEQALSITTLSEKCSMGVIPIIYKRPDEKQRAHQCFHELWQRGVEIGCHPYRINIAAMQELTKSQDSTFWHTVAQIKSALDPDGILSPGRYARVSDEGHSCAFGPDDGEAGFAKVGSRVT